MEKFALIAVAVVLLWIALKIARLFVRLLLLAAIIGIGAYAYFVYLR